LKNSLRHWITVTESMFNKEISDPMPGGFHYPEMPANNPYHAYRFGLHMANSKEMNKESPSGQNAVIVPYSPVENDIIKSAEKSTGYSGIPLTTPKSNEPRGGNVVSPVAKFTPNKKSR
jgi:hypothetical protein